MMSILLKILPVLLIALAIGFYIDRRDPAPVFSIEDWSQLLDSAPAQEYSGAILVNLDETPELELFLTSLVGKNLTLKYSGDSFRRLGLKALDASGDRVTAVIGCDLTGDGRDEIFLLGSPSKLFSYHNGTWKQDPITLASSDGKSVTCLDRLGHGTYGLVIVSEKSPIQFIEHREGRFIDISFELGFDASPSSNSIVAVPGPEGRTGFIIGTDEVNHHYMNDGQGRFKDASKNLGLRDSEFKTKGFTIADLNHDELPDLIYGNNLGPLRFLVQGRTGVWKAETPATIRAEYAVNSPVFADLNLDGHEDLYLNNRRNANRLYTKSNNKWRELETGSFRESDRYGIGTLLGDLDHKPGLEILNTHGDGRAFTPTLYHIKPIGHWVGVEVKLKNGGIPRGAALRLHTNRRELLRVVDSGSGNFANHSPEIFFGMLDDETPLTLEIQLPSGKIFRPELGLRINKLNVVQLK